ncbi:MAG TPA: GIDE domain-containing protein [Xanthobacteraceae bacterium]|nr:GIDE domain-containing protein [Xanthobacteraceae bacterium]
MNWVLIGAGAIVGIVAAGFLFYRMRLIGERALMAKTQTSRAADVASLPPGSTVEVIGTLRCPNPVMGEFSNLPCAWFRSEINRTVTRPNNQGTETTRVHYNTMYAPCLVEDASGRVNLNLDGAEVEGQQVVNREEMEGGAVNVIVNAMQNVNARRRYTETILAPNIAVYVLGQVQADQSIGKHGSTSNVFVVSNRSKEERSKSLGHWITGLLVLGIVLAIVAIGLIGWGLRG